MTTTKVISSPTSTASKPEKPWHHHLTIDLFLTVLNRTFLHPFVAWMLPLSLRAQATPYTHTAMQVTIAWALLLTLIYILGLISDRIAYGAAREVDLSDEVIVVTGGASGLGALIAEVYGMRGASVAVVDVRNVEEGEAEEKGIKYYECDVGDRKQVEEVRKKIEEDVSITASRRIVRWKIWYADLAAYLARHSHHPNQQCGHCERKTSPRTVPGGDRKVRPLLMLSP